MRKTWVAEITPTGRVGYMLRLHEQPGPEPNGWLCMEKEHRPRALTRRGAERKARRLIERFNRAPESWQIPEAQPAVTMPPTSVSYPVDDG